MRQDIALSDAQDLTFANGDFAVAQSDDRHVYDLVSSAKGEYKQQPLVGANLTQFLKSGAREELASVAMYRQLQADGYRVDTLEVGNGLWNIEVSEEDGTV